MSSNYKSSFYHGIMFHHFHDNKFHLRGQGSIDSSEFRKIINFIGKKNILSPEEFIHKLENKNLKKTDLCLTFDDALKCQHNIALPVLKDFKLKAFFFIYTSIFTKNPNMLEFHRFFRMNYYKKVDEFYDEFFGDEYLQKYLRFLNKKKIIRLFKTYKKKFPFYTFNDVKFRILRDYILNKKSFDKIMMSLFKKKRFNYKSLKSKLFMSKSDISNLCNSGNLIGLHSHSHPYQMQNLNYNNQKKEYKKNEKFLKKIVGKNIISMSHPSGSYNNNTIKILKKMNIEIGFKQIMTIDKNMKKINNSNLEIARQDHSYFKKRI